MEHDSVDMDGYDEELDSTNSSNTNSEDFCGSECSNNDSVRTLLLTLHFCVTYTILSCNSSFNTCVIDIISDFWIIVFVNT